MKLSEKQIQELFVFTQKKLVRYYDLQVELVDHLAASIEEEMHKDEKLSFEAALHKVYKGFGIFGFAKIVQEKQQQLLRKHKKQWYREFKNLFQWPEILQSAFILYVLWLIVYYAPAPIVIVLCFAALFAAPIFTAQHFQKTRKDRKLMMMQYVPQGNFMIYFVNQLLFVTIFDHQHALIGLYVILAVAVLFLIVNIRILKAIHREARRNYPEAFA